nr:flavodoxin reductases (ferredoxin-NADPH reductases) family 1 [uncultured bacterium]
MSDFSSLVISNIEQNTSNSVILSFEVPSDEKEKFNFKSGQYLTLEAVVNDQKVRRSYSICSMPNEVLQVGIKQIPEGVFSSFGNNVLQIKDSLLVGSPQGRFLYDPKGTSEKIVAFAAGSGITPIMSMIKTVLSSHPENQFSLVYGNKTPEDTMFLNELKELEKTFESRFKVTWVFSQSNEKNSFFGRIEAPVVKNFLNNCDKPVDHFYLCGPEQMINTVSDTLVEKTVLKENIHFELFTASEKKGAAAVESNSERASLEIIYDEESYKFENAKGKSVLDLALQNNIDVPYSCQGGVCSSCIAKIKEGTVTMDNNQVLTDEEIEEGLILTCQAHISSSHLKVDYDDV